VSEAGLELAAQALVDPTAFAMDAKVSQLVELRAHLNEDLFAFAQVVFGYRDLIPSLHGDLAAYISEWGWCYLADGSRKYFTDVSSSDSIVLDNRRLMTQIPREFFKTSLGTRANALWQICREPHLPVAIFNERQENAQRWMRGIRDVVQGNKLFQQLYRDILPPGVHFADTRNTPRYWKWSDSELDLGGKDMGEVEPSIGAHGIESASVGGHWPKMILDDLISLKHKLSPSEMERAREWLKGHIYLMRPSERSMAYMNCTPWAYNDIYRDATEHYGYRLYRRAGLEDKNGQPDVALGESIFPQKLSTEQLRRMHDRDPFGFSSQIQCIPKSGKEQSFAVSDIRYGSVGRDEQNEPVFSINAEHYDPRLGAADPAEPPPRQHMPLHQLEKCLILDPAPTEMSDIKRDPHARSAVLAVAMDCHDRRFVLAAWAQRADYMDTIGQCFKFGLEWGIDTLYVEEVNFSNVYRHWIAREQERDGRFAGQSMRVLPLYPKGREKHMRIRALIPYFQQGLMYVNRAECAQYLVELAEYPNSDTVDLLDCMGYMPECLHRPPTAVELRQMRRAQKRGAAWSEPYYEGVESY
jgi:hypothetical protein